MLHHTPKNPCLDPLQPLVSILTPLQSSRQTNWLVAVAFSGGADSTALLLAAHALWGKRVLALHVNHGLQPEANDMFAKHCVQQCDHLGVTLAIHKANISVHKRQSLEAAARQARYLALAGMAHKHGIAVVLLAQHQDDQAESVLLALSRGAGLPGLAGMNPDFEQHGVRFIRPLLSISAKTIRNYLSAIQQAFIKDPMNTDMQRTRGKLRHAVLPVLQQHFPGIVQTLVRSARHAAVAKRLLDTLGKNDCERCIFAVDAETGTQLDIKALQTLSPERLENALRYWLVYAVQTDSLTVLRAPSHAQLQALQKQIRACKTRGHNIDLKVGQGMVQRQGPALVWIPKKQHQLL